MRSKSMVGFLAKAAHWNTLLIQKPRGCWMCRVSLHLQIGLGGSIAADNQFLARSPTLLTSLSVYSGAVKKSSFGYLPSTRLACERGRFTGDCWKWPCNQFPFLEVSVPCFCKGLLMWQLRRNAGLFSLLERIGTYLWSFSSYSTGN